jgi:hypothetical protein
MIGFVASLLFVFSPWYYIGGQTTEVGEKVWEKKGR